MRLPGGERAASGVAAVAFTGFLVPGLVDAVRAAAWPVPATVLALPYLAVGIGGVPLAGADPARRRAVAYGMAGLGLALVTLLGAGASWLLVSAVAVAAALRPWREAALLTAGLVAGLALTGSPGGNLAVLAAVGAAAAAAVALADANAALRAARAEIDRLVVARERSRISRDLHDVLGHGLTTITVKAGLARQLLAAGRVEQAAAEVGDVERLARQAVADVRSTVAGTRETSLPGELAAARQTLRAAGIEADLPAAADEVPAALREPFAHVLREGVTNAVRHSAARRVTVRLAPDSITVHDDGPAPAGPVGEGSGLRGLRERLAAVGATLRHGPAAGGGYDLVAGVDR